MKYEFEIKDMLPIGVTIVVVGMVLAFGLEIMGDVRDDIGENTCAARSDSYTTFNATQQQCQNASGNLVDPGSAEYNATIDGITGVSKLPEKLPLIATVIVAVIIIGILVRFFTVR